MLSVHTGWYHRPAYVRRSGVPVPAGIGAPQGYWTLVSQDTTLLHGGEGGDVELGARTSKHIMLLAFDPLSL